MAIRHILMPGGLSVVGAAAHALRSLWHVLWSQHAARLLVFSVATCSQQVAACMLSACELTCSLGTGVPAQGCAPWIGMNANIIRLKHCNTKPVASKEVCVEVPGPLRLKCKCIMNPLAKHAVQLLVFGCRQQEGRAH